MNARLVKIEFVPVLVVFDDGSRIAAEVRGNPISLFESQLEDVVQIIRDLTAKLAADQTQLAQLIEKSTLPCSKQSAASR